MKKELLETGYYRLTNRDGEIRYIASGHWNTVLANYEARNFVTARSETNLMWRNAHSMAKEARNG